MRIVFLALNILFITPFNQAQAADYTWVTYDNTQGFYPGVGHIFDERTPRQPPVSTYPTKLRFINIGYVGPADGQKWRDAFKEAIRYYIDKNLNCKLGADGDFFTIDPTKNFRILGWVEETSGFFGYIVVTGIDRGEVLYVTSDGRVVRQEGPGNFEYFTYAKTNYSVGPGLGEDKYRVDYDAAMAVIQIWRHADTLTAGASFRLKTSASEFDEPNPPEKPLRRTALHYDVKTKHTFEFEQTGHQHGGYLNVWDLTDRRRQIHTGQFMGTFKYQNQEYYVYKVVFSVSTGPRWMLDATNAGNYQIWIPREASGEWLSRVLFFNAGALVPEADVPPAGIIWTQSYPVRLSYFND